MASIVHLRCGRGASMYLALFFLAVAGTPHRHLNDLQDLLLAKSPQGRRRAPREA
jgi:hypothetical protein